MATYGSDNLPEGFSDDLIRLTRQELYESTDFDDGEKSHLFRAMDFLEALGLNLYLFPSFPCLYLSDDELYSEIISVDKKSLATLTSMLEFMCVRQGINGESNSYAQLERRIGAIETVLGEKLPNSTSDKEYLRYLHKFKDMIPKFEEVNVTLTIDEDKRVAYYKNNSTLHTDCAIITYDISQDGYYRATRAMRACRYALNRQRNTLAKSNKTTS